MKPLTVGQKIKIGEDTFTILEFLEEPNTGLCRIESRGWGLVIPTALLSEIERLRDRHSFARDTVAALRDACDRLMGDTDIDDDSSPEMAAMRRATDVLGEYSGPETVDEVSEELETLLSILRTNYRHGTPPWQAADEIERLRKELDDTRRRDPHNTGREFGPLGSGPGQGEVSLHICRGSSSETCACTCPDGPCEHVWDGEWVEEELPGGGGEIGSVTCSKCGMRRIDHDMWCGP